MFFDLNDSVVALFHLPSFVKVIYLFHCLILVGKKIRMCDTEIIKSCHVMLNVLHGPREDTSGAAQSVLVPKICSLSGGINAGSSTTSLHTSRCNSAFKS